MQKIQKLFLSNFLFEINAKNIVNNYACYKSVRYSFSCVIDFGFRCMLA